MTESARAGIVGAGGIGRVHLDALRRIGVEVTAVAGATPERTVTRARELGIPRACGSVEELVARDDVDVVHVCTPNAMHERHVMLALTHGKHVICEKPLAVSSAEADHLHREAEERGLIHAVAYNYRFYPMVGAMRSIVQGGRLGRAHLVRGAYLADFLLTLDDPGNWVLDPGQIGPALALADIGVHWWDLAEFVSGQRVTAALCERQTARDPDAWGEDSTAIMFRLDGGAIATAALSCVAAGHGNTIQLEVVGTTASVRWEQEDPERLWYTPVGEAQQLLVRPLGTSTQHYATQVPFGHPQGYLDGFAELIGSVYSRIARSTEVEHPTFEDGARGLRVLEALLESSERQSWVEVAVAP